MAVSKDSVFGRAPQRSKILIVQAPLRVNFAIQVWIAKEGAFVREKPPRKTPILYNPEKPPGGRFFCCRRIFQHPATGNSAAHSFPHRRNLADCPIAFFAVSCFIIFSPFFPAPPPPVQNRGLSPICFHSLPSPPFFADKRRALSLSKNSSILTKS